MNMKTLTIEQVFQQMADNVRAGKSPVDGLQGSSDGEGWLSSHLVYSLMIFYPTILGSASSPEPTT